MTRRERLEAKIAKREEWAEGRKAKAENLRAVHANLRHDWAFITQPGRIIERERMNRRDARAYEHSKVADHHAAKAAGLQAHLDRTIFTDDDNAAEALEARIAEREAEADKKAAWNAAWKRGASAAEKAAKTAGKTSSEDLLTARLNGGEAGLKASGASPAIIQAANAVMEQGYSWIKAPFDLTHLRASIRRDRERLAEVRARQSTAQKAEESSTGFVIEGGDYVTVTFAEKPSRVILDRLKDAGFLWRGGSWCGARADLPPCLTITTTTTIGQGDGA